VVAVPVVAIPVVALPVVAIPVVTPLVVPVVPRPLSSLPGLLEFPPHDQSTDDGASTPMSAASARPRRAFVGDAEKSGRRWAFDS
jgi:hypothetical protein